MITDAGGKEGLVPLRHLAHAQPKPGCRIVRAVWRRIYERAHCKGTVSSPSAPGHALDPRRPKPTLESLVALTEALALIEADTAQAWAHNL